MRKIFQKFVEGGVFMKRVLFLSLALAICLSFVSTAFAAQTVTKVENGVEFVLVEPDLQTRADVINGYTYDSDGGRETNGPANQQRVWGWSTCVNSNGKDTWHYTVAQYEDIFGNVKYTSGRTWGYGKVYAHSPWIYLPTARELTARVYYGRTSD